MPRLSVEEVAYGGEGEIRMLAKKCDRCGAFYEPYNVENNKEKANGVAKLGKNETVRMDVLMKIAVALDCKVEDLFETVKDGDDKNA